MKFNYQKIKDGAVIVGIAASFFAMPVVYQFGKEKAIERFLLASGCIDVGEPTPDNHAVKILKKGYLCPSEVIGGPAGGQNVVPIYK